ncbi:MAG: hypothetical protein ACO1PB_02755 [Ramlibacter sp.]
MSFLHQLKNQATALQTQRSAIDEQLEAKSALVESACTTVLSYLQDLARQLNVIEPESAPFSLDGKTPWPPMKQVDFRVDARRKMIRDREVFDYVAMGWRVEPKMGVPVCGVVRVNFPTEQQRVESRLAMGPVKHDRREVRHPEKGSLVEVRYEYVTQTRGSVMVRADHERAQLHFRLLNTSGFETLTATWPAQRVDVGVLDELAKRIVAQPDRFV